MQLLEYLDLFYMTMQKMHSPSTDEEPESLQVPLEGGPECGRHAVLVLGVAVLPGGLLQGVQVAVPGSPEQEYSVSRFALTSEK